MQFLLRRSSVWVLLNAAGAGAYLKLASALWVLPGEEGMPGGPGDAFYWLFCLVPVLVAFLSVNAAALFVIVRRSRASKSRTALVIWLAVAVLWVGTVAFDYYKSDRVIDARYSMGNPLERGA